MGELEVGLDIDPETGAADSEDIEIDLPNLFEALGDAAKEKRCAVAILIDEVRYLSQKELGALIKVNSIGPVRAKLIKKGMIYSPARLTSDEKKVVMTMIPPTRNSALA
jgi:hypothetical protein